MDLISVVVPVYNVEKYLDKCLMSITQQTYVNMQIILVDDGSTDNSGIICDTYKQKDDRIDVVHQINGGLSNARNTGIDIAHGKYIVFVDSDDYIDKNYIEALHQACVSTKKDIAVCGRRVCYKTHTEIEYSHKKTYILNRNQALKAIMRTKLFNMAAWDKMYSLHLFEDVRYPNGKIHEDVFITPLLIEKSNGVVTVNNTYYNYVMREESITHCSFNEATMDLYKNASDFYNHFSDSEWQKDKQLVFRYYYLMVYTCTKKYVFSEVDDKKKYFEYYNKLLCVVKENLFRIIFNKELNIKCKIFSLLFALKIIS